jgi:hypothetical protein
MNTVFGTYRSFMKNGPYNIVVIQKNFTNCMEILGTPISLILAVYVPV